MFLSQNSQKRYSILKRLLPFVVLALLSLQIAAVDHLHIDGEPADCHLCVSGTDAPLISALTDPAVIPTFLPGFFPYESVAQFVAVELPRVRGPPVDS